MSKSAKIWLAIGLGGAALVVGGLITAYFVFMNYAERTLGPPAEAFLAKAQAQDYDAAYALAGPRWKQKQTLEDYRQFEQKVRDRLGPLIDKNFIAAQFQSNTGGSFATLTYSAKFENGRGTITVSLFKQNGEWIVEGVNYQSPLLKSDEPAQ